MGEIDTIGIIAHEFCELLREENKHNPDFAISISQNSIGNCWVIEADYYSIIPARGQLVVFFHATFGPEGVKIDGFYDSKKIYPYEDPKMFDHIMNDIKYQITP